MFTTLLATITLTLSPHAAVTAPANTVFGNARASIGGQRLDSNRGGDLQRFRYRGRVMLTFNGLTFRNTSSRRVRVRTSIWR